METNEGYRIVEEAPRNSVSVLE